MPEATRYPGETDEADIVGTLVRPVQQAASDVAVLYVHGWNDYFFQTHLADYWTSADTAFYALDLRRYGRSFQPGLLFGFTTDLSEYYAELDAALELIRAEHSHVLLMGHSTGGLISTLYAADRPGELAALVLNSPWLDLQGSQAVRALGPPMAQSVGTLRPTTPLSLSEGFTRRSTHVEHGGEWDYDLDLKTGADAVVRAGWLQAVLNGHQRVAKGLGIGCPILVLASGRSLFRRNWDEQMTKADVVLDVRQISERAVRLGLNVTIIRIPDGMHDLVLSAEPVRDQVFFEITRWMGAYGPRGPATQRRAMPTQKPAEPEASWASAEDPEVSYPA
ncbi:alpha/beta hydrolase [Naumannella halotolerans]|uniref:alpha/beta hydrolase n=1 Tax=Naumannella halotolerans TaxID=993414 RepID=UPI00370D29C1